MRVAYVIYRHQERYTEGANNNEDIELLEFLQRKGLPIHPVFWNDQAIDWAAYDVVILKSPWDYHEQLSAFYDWLDRIAAAGIRLLNPVDVVKWNSNKRYLRDIAEAGLPVIPSIYVSRGSTLPIDDSLFAALDASKMVIKPCVSGGAKNTFTLTRENIRSQQAHIDALLAEEDYLVQPFVAEVAQGEWSFLYFNGRYSHSVLKIPKPGDFRVQHQHGGQIVYPEADPGLLLQAEKYVQRFAQSTLYTRVDGIVKDGVFQLMELELIEPYLFLNSETQRLENYYEAVASLLGG